MFELILHRLSLWLKVADANFSYTGNDLFRSLNGILELREEFALTHLSFKIAMLGSMIIFFEIFVVSSFCL